jgi:hypothetical protein
MRARRRDREHVAGNGRANGNGSSGDGNGKGGRNDGGNRNRSNGKGGGGGGGGGNRGKGRRRKRNRNRNNGNKADNGNRGQAARGAGFWGDPERLPSATRDVRITDDPAAVARSLGAPPLPGHEKIAEHYFTVVYERAVQTAGALAAAGGLIDPEALTGGSDGS